MKLVLRYRSWMLTNTIDIGLRLYRYTPHSNRRGDVRWHEWDLIL
jgi:hypothetical protein